MNLDLAAIERRNAERRRLRDAATPGPWSVVADYNLKAPDPRGGSRCPLTNSNLGHDEKKATFAFIAASRSDTVPEDIDALLARVKELEAHLAESIERRTR
jgi:hypothetical protein